MASSPKPVTYPASPLDDSQLQRELADFTPRPYQLELYEQVKKHNSILVLGSGAGKTFISILLIKDLAHQVRGPLSSGNKRTVFVVNNVPLVYQQAEVIRRHTPLTVTTYEGSMGTDHWNDDKWKGELEETEVLVLTAQIFLDLVLHARLPLSSVNLLIMDECHHATGKHPMREIMRQYESLKKTSPDLCPQVLGLTACVLRKRCAIEDVRHNIKNLEVTMSGILVVCSEREALNYSLGPKEKIISFYYNKPSKYLKDIMCMLEEILKEAGELFAEKKFQTLVKKKISNIKHAVVDLGEWCAPQAIMWEMLDLYSEENEDNSDAPEVREVQEFLLTKLKLIHSVCEKAKFLLDCPKDYITPKVKTLLNILRSCSKDVHGIIFVERKNITRILCELLLDTSVTNFDLGFVKPSYLFCCSSQQGTNIYWSDLEKKRQKETLKMFHSGDCNFIVSTNLLEEGINVRNCNIVIRFDRPVNYCSYLQSRGRAQARLSKYYLMIPTDELPQFRERLAVYKEIEASLSELCQESQLPNDSETSFHFATDQSIPPYEPYGADGPKVTMNSAIPLIILYCQELPTDRFTELTPKVTYQGEVESVRAGIRLPINACLKEVVYGEWMKTRELAKKSAAINMCRRLHHMGQLDYHLKPGEQKKEDVVVCNLVEVPEERPVPHGAAEPGTKRRQQIYTKEICQAFTPLTTREYHLYSLSFVPQDTQSENKLSVNLFNLSVGLLCKKDLIHYPFLLHSPILKEVEIRINPEDDMPSPTTNIMNLVKHFHILAVEHLFQINSSILQFSPGHFGMYIVPLTISRTIDLTLLQKLEPLMSLRPLVNNSDFHFDRQNYEDSIIYPLYAPTDPMFYVTKILDDTNPLSKFPGACKGYDSYEQYFYIKYNMKITNKHQPLLVAKHMIKELNYLKRPVLVAKKKTKNLDRDPPKFVPELCGVMPLKATLWWQMMCIPSIVYRLNSFCLAYQLGASLNPIYCQSDTSAVSTNSIAAKKMTVEETFEILVDSPSSCKNRYMHPNLLVQAMTLRQSNDERTLAHTSNSFNLERLEILGDAFLKYITAEYLSLKFPLEHEGHLSLTRVKLVCNLTLYSLAKIKNIPEKIQSGKFHPLENGLQLGFVVKRRVEKQLRRMRVAYDLWPNIYHCISIGNITEAIESAKNMRENENSCFNPWSQQELSDKSVADVVESLVGAYLVTCGTHAALDFLHNLGFGVYNGESLLKSKIKVASPMINDEPCAVTELDEMYKRLCLDKLERKINYSFRDKSFLLQAVTHSSSTNNKITDCYQRLEFLGDAILDYLITCMIFSRHDKYSPGQMSHLRAYYVKNETLALVCVNARLHEHLLHMCPNLQAAIDKFMTIMNTGGDVEELKIEQDDVDVKEIDLPKVLGDLVESIIGAVYLDSNKSLQKTWGVVETVMGRIINKALPDIPLDCIRKLFDEMPGEITFRKRPRDPKSEVAEYEVMVCGVVRVTGTGNNYKRAKINAAKNALTLVYQARSGSPEHSPTELSQITGLS